MLIVDYYVVLDPWHVACTSTLLRSLLDYHARFVYFVDLHQTLIALHYNLFDLDIVGL